MYYIGLDVHKKTISYCVKDAAGCVHREGKIGSSRRELDAWVRTLPQPRMMAMEAVPTLPGHSTRLRDQHAADVAIWNAERSLATARLPQSTLR
jgi:hypothetical protein